MGEKIIVVEKNETINIIAVGNIRNARGIVKNIRSSSIRDENDRFD
ncbi:hypothetical protein HYZ41_01665 [archaeon]|nr:hypothetical protein [archaeon]